MPEGWSIDDHRYTRRTDGTGSWQGGSGVYSSSLQIKVNGETRRPAAPANLSAEAGNRQVELNWDNPNNNTITEYQLRTDDSSSFAEIDGSGAGTTSHTVYNLNNGTQYTLELRALNDGGQGTRSTVTATPLWPAPTGLEVDPGDGQVELTWDTGHSDIAGYEVDAKDTTDGSTPEPFFTPSGSGLTTTAIMSGLTNGAGHTFTVRAAKKVSGGNIVITGKLSEITATPLAVPAAPANLLPVPVDGEITLTWSNPENDTIAGYQVSADGGEEFDNINGSGSDTTTHTLTGLINGESYNLHLRAVNASGPGDAAEVTATPLAKPAIPAGLVANAADGYVVLSWSSPGNNTIQKYEISTNGGMDFSDIDGSNWTTTTHTVSNLANGTTYTMALRAVNASGPGGYAEVTATPLSIPNAPENVTATQGDESATELAWDNPNDSSINHYEVSTDGGSNFAEIDGSDANTTSHTVTKLSDGTDADLTNGTAYTIALRAVNANETAGPWTTITATPLWPAPANLTAIVGNELVDLEWDSNSSITHYRVHTQSDGETLENSNLELSGTNEKTKTTITSLTNSKEYQFTVQAVDGPGPNAAITGQPSSAVATPNAVPDKPTGVNAVAGNGKVTLTWSLPNNNPNNSTITGYKVSADNGNNFDPIPGSDRYTTTHTLTGLRNGQEYSLVVRAVNQNGDGSKSDAANAVPLGPAPTGLVAQPDNERVVFKWNRLKGISPQGEPYDIHTYWVTVTDPVTDLVVGDHDGIATILTFEIQPHYAADGLINGKEYRFTVGAWDSGIVPAAYSSATASVDATPNGSLPEKPSGLVAEPKNKKIKLTWNDPEDATITEYQIRENGVGAFSKINILWDATEYTVGGLENGDEYVLELRAKNATGAGPASDVTATPVVVPAAPDGLTADPGDSEVTLNWINPG
ncbi:MAG: fibronectin type III domain-containing protein, partial [Rhodobacteraceae bacterium]|nr:fibronectin type III domain-containing protein [Paracoccaceae bacterium]